MNAPGLFMHGLSLAVCAVLYVAPHANADVYMKHRHRTEAHTVMGKEEPAREATVVTRIAKSMARMDYGADSSVVMDLDNGIVRFVDHKTRTFAELNFREMEQKMNKAMEDASVSEDGMQQMASMLQSMFQFKASVTKTTQKKKIGSWACTKYDVEMTMPMGGTRSEIWTTTGAAVKPELYQRLKNSGILSMPGIREMLVEFEKIEGIPVLTTTEATVMGSTVSSTEELLELKELTVPPKEYAVPRGYKKKGSR